MLRFNLLKRGTLAQILTVTPLHRRNSRKHPQGVAGAGGYTRLSPKGSNHVSDLPSRHAQRAPLPVASHARHCVLLLPRAPRFSTQEFSSRNAHRAPCQTRPRRNPSGSSSGHECPRQQPDQLPPRIHPFLRIANGHRPSRRPRPRACSKSAQPNRPRPAVLRHRRPASPKERALKPRSNDSRELGPAAKCDGATG
jgi:hypothetical protein